MQSLGTIQHPCLTSPQLGYLTERSEQKLRKFTVRGFLSMKLFTKGEYLYPVLILI